MAKSRQQKTQEVSGIAEELKGSKSVVFADVSSLKVNDGNALRRKAQKENVPVSMAKKTLLRIAFKEAGIEGDVSSLDGSVSLFYGKGDEVAPAKIVADFRKDFEKVRILGGILDSKWMTAEEVAALAQLPSKQELLAKLVGTINAPVSGFVNVLAANVRGIVQVLSAIKDKKTA